MDHAKSQDLHNSQDIGSDEIIVSSIRTGMKREFAMMMQAESVMGTLPVGRRRVTGSRIESSVTRNNVGSGLEEKLEGFGTKRIAKDAEEQNGRKGVSMSDNSEVSYKKRKGKSCVLRVGVDEGDEIPRDIRSTREPLEVVLKSDLDERTAESGDVISAGCQSKFNKKMPKPPRFKDLLNTGLLETLPVCYIRGSKRRGHSESGLGGIIKNSGILCSCNECKGNKIVTPIQFELHAHSHNKRPLDYIYFNNGKSLQDVLEACKNSISLEIAIKKAIGDSASGLTASCSNCKGVLEACSGRSMLLCDLCAAPKKSDISPDYICDTSKREFGVNEKTSHRDSTMPDANSAAMSRLRSMAHPQQGGQLPTGSLATTTTSSKSEIRAPASSEMSSKSKQKAMGQLTKKDSRMHKLVFDKNVLPDGTHLSYVIDKEKRAEGYIKDGAIFCLCCSTLVSPSKFEAHAGFASRRSPYMNIFTSNGVSLHELSVQLSKKHGMTLKKSDTLCSTCGNGGNLLYCETCPRAFHSDCISRANSPEGQWRCRFCQNKFRKEKLAKLNANAIAAGRVAGIDALEEINQQRIRIVGTKEDETSGCALCGEHYFCSSKFNEHAIIICDQCEKEYHVGCLREKNLDDLKELPEDKWFCCTQCRNINNCLQGLVKDGEQMLPETCLNLAKKKQDEECSDTSRNVIRWRILSGDTASKDDKELLSKAVSVFHERFDPIADSSTSHLDLISQMVYGISVKDQNFGGMHCALLMVDSFVVSAALVRIFGQEVAELPLVATSSEFQGKGYFRSLFICISNLLTSLKVKNLVLPAAHEAELMWRSRFGFEKLNQRQLEEYKKNYPIFVFDGTTVLYKSVSTP